MSKPISKEELKSKDAFLTLGDKILAVLEKNAKFLVGFFLLIILGGAGYAGYVKWSHMQEVAAQDVLFIRMNALTTKQKEIKEKPEGDKTFATHYAAAVAEVEKEIKNHKGTFAAQTTAMRLADFLSEQKEAKRALEVLQSVESSVSKQNMLYGLFGMQISALLSQQGDLDQAISHLKNVTESKKVGFLHPEASLKEAILLEQKGDAEKAKQIYSQLSLDHPDTDAGRTAQGKLYLLQLSGGAAKTAAP